MPSPTFPRLLFNQSPSVTNISIKQRHADCLTLVQISDLHLYRDATKRYNHVNPHQSFEKVVAMIRQSYGEADLLMVTGDLLQEPSTQGYDALFDDIETLNIPYVPIAGNHDVTLELDSHLPFEQRRHIGITPDPRLVNCKVVSSEHWDILCLDSSVKGQIYGGFSEETLAWLARTLASSEKPCIIFAHHPMMRVESAWIDQHRLKNTTDFWQVVAPFASRIKGIFVGHVHQETQAMYQGISVFTCPSTSVQFKPFSYDYCVDDKQTAGLRWLTLYNNGMLATGIKRVDTI